MIRVFCVTNSACPKSKIALQRFMAIQVSFDPVDFKFKYLDDEGNEVGFRKQNGCFDGKQLILGDDSIPILSIHFIQTRGKYFIVSIAGDDEQFTLIPLSIYGIDSEKLRRAVDGRRSGQLAKIHHEQLKTEHREHLYREFTCEYCRATVVLTGFSESPQLYCEYCDSLQSVKKMFGEASDNESAFSLCEECEMFSKPRKFTIFYFYFLLVAYGFFHRSTQRCPGCMRGDAWKMLFGNLPFVIGIPVALTQLFRSYAGSVIKGRFQGLDDANNLAKRNRIDRALKKYQVIIERNPIHAGIKYNIGVGLSRKQDWKYAEKILRMALEDCANYWPAFWLLVDCLEEQGKSEETLLLCEQYGEQPVRDLASNAAVVPAAKL